MESYPTDNEAVVVQLELSLGNLLRAQSEGSSDRGEDDKSNGPAHETLVIVAWRSRLPEDIGCRHDGRRTGKNTGASARRPFEGMM